MPKIIYHAQAQDLDYSSRIAYNILGDTMETRKAKMIINKSGGTASSHGKTYRVTIPNSWIEQLGIDEKTARLSYALTVRILSSEKSKHCRNIKTHTNGTSCCN